MVRFCKALIYVLEFFVSFPSYMSEKIFCTIVIGAVKAARVKSLLSIILDHLFKFRQL